MYFWTWEYSSCSQNTWGLLQFTWPSCCFGFPTGIAWAVFFFFTFRKRIDFSRCILNKIVLTCRLMFLAYHETPALNPTKNKRNCKYWLTFGVELYQIPDLWNHRLSNQRLFFEKTTQRSWGRCAQKRCSMPCCSFKIWPTFGEGQGGKGDLVYVKGYEHGNGILIWN